MTSVLASESGRSGSRLACPCLGENSPYRILVAEDDEGFLDALEAVLTADGRFAVVGRARNGHEALELAARLRIDAVVMDIEMPELDGIGAVRALRAAGCTVPIIMFSTLTEQGAVATFDALAAGASDYVAKPANVGSVTQSLQKVRTDLIPRIKALVPESLLSQASRLAHLGPAATRGLAPSAGHVATPVPAGPPVRARTDPQTEPVRLLTIGCSTGGPEALGRLLRHLPTLPVPVAVVQHMPPVFTRQFAGRLDRQLPFDVVEAEHGTPMQPGTVYIAPGDHHLSVSRTGTRMLTVIDSRPPENSCRPAVDVLFRSAAQHTKAGTLAVVLTGMGADGCLGAADIVRAGGSVLIQDEASSVVWGMPGAVSRAGLAEESLSVEALASAIIRRTTPHEAHARRTGRESR
jgi:two-component system, chemotaxis family, protein-glutamate methylesterase/glutaminase